MSSPQVIEHQPQKIFVVDIVFKTGRARQIKDVVATVTAHEDVSYMEYMVVQQKNGTSTYVNMVEVEDLVIGEQNG